MKTIDTFRRSTVRAAFAATLAAGLAAPAPVLAQEITLRAVSGFQEGTYFSRNFERFVQRVNAEGKGLVQINYLGGPKAIPTFEQGNALRTGVIDLANTTAAYTASLVPEGLARARSSWSRSSRAGCGRPTSATRRSTSSPGTATTRRTSTTCAASTRSARSASTTPIRRSSSCCSRCPTRPVSTRSTS
jgi:hypothetical protein